MKNRSLLIKLVVGAALVCLSLSPLYGQGRTLTTTQLDNIVKPQLAQCSAPANQVKNARLDPYAIIPTANARQFPVNRITKTLHGIWRGQVIGSPLDVKYERSKEGNVDYFWIIDTTRSESLTIALRNGANSTAGMSIPNAPKISYLICAHEGYIPTVEKGSEIHEFTKVSDSIAEAGKVLSKATGVQFKRGTVTLADYWKAIVASNYFRTLPAVAFAGGFFKPMRIESVPSAIGPAQLSMSWNAEYYGGGTTWIKFTPGVPMQGAEATQFVGTTATAGDFLVASPGNGKLAKVEARAGGDYDLAFDAVSFGPLQGAGVMSAPTRTVPGRIRNQHRAGVKKNNHGRRN